MRRPGFEPRPLAWKANVLNPLNTTGAYANKIPNLRFRIYEETSAFITADRLRAIGRRLPTVYDAYVVFLRFSLKVPTGLDSRSDHGVGTRKQAGRPRTLKTNQPAFPSISASVWRGIRTPLGYLFRLRMTWASTTHTIYHADWSFATPFGNYLVCTPLYL